MSKFVSTSEAYRIAKERSSVAAAFEMNLLHRAVFDAREKGMSVREAAAALNVPKSTVDRHWREGHQCPEVLPVWGSETAWRDAHAAVWAHDSEELADDWVPFEWNGDGSPRTVKVRTRKLASVLRGPVPGPAPTPDACAGGACGHCKRCLERLENSDQ